MSAYGKHPHRRLHLHQHQHLQNRLWYHRPRNQRNLLYRIQLLHQPHPLRRVPTHPISHLRTTRRRLATGLEKDPAEDAINPGRGNSSEISARMHAGIVRARTTRPSALKTFKGTTVTGWVKGRKGVVAKSGKDKSSSFTIPFLVMSALKPVYLFNGIACYRINLY